VTDTRRDDSVVSPGIFADTPSSGDRLPIPPLRLRRVHLQGVGPDGARFDPLDLDFTAIGGAASRVLLSLTNTGGKSTLITLISSLVVPASRAQVGGKHLGDYVLTTPPTSCANGRTPPPASARLRARSWNGKTGAASPGTSSDPPPICTGPGTCSELDLACRALTTFPSSSTAAAPASRRMSPR
jgi:hypothetical protein